MCPHPQRAVGERTEGAKSVCQWGGRLGRCWASVLPPTDPGRSVLGWLPLSSCSNPDGHDARRCAGSVLLVCACMACVFVHMCDHLSLCTRVNACTCTPGVHKWVCTGVYTRVHICVRLCVCTCVRVHLLVHACLRPHPTPPSTPPTSPDS